jgi:hypothetical protein
MKVQFDVLLAPAGEEPCVFVTYGTIGPNAYTGKMVSLADHIQILIWGLRHKNIVGIGYREAEEDHTKMIA